MSLTTPPRTETARTDLGEDIRVTQLRVIHSEWIKLRTLRSSWISFFAAAGGMIGIALLACWATNHNWANRGPIERLTFDPASLSLRGAFFAQLVVGVLGVLVVSGEYGTGMIRASLAAVPRRLPILWAKLSVFVAATFVVSLSAALISFFGGQAFLGIHGTTLGAPGSLRDVIGAALYLTIVGVFAMGLGFALQNTAGGIASLFGLLLILPIIVQALPYSWVSHIYPYLPMPAGSAVYSRMNDVVRSLAPWTGLGVFCIWAAVAVALGAWVLIKRDA